MSNPTSQLIVVGFAALLLLAVVICFVPGASIPTAQNITANDSQLKIANVQHIIFIIKENRTFDNYFRTFTGADGAMVCSFIASAEYQQRFSPFVTHTNQECPQ